MSTTGVTVTKVYPKRVAIVTGSARGIGKAIAIRLAEDGFDVCINDIAANQAGVDDVVSEIKALGRQSIGCIADVSSLSEVETMISTTVSQLGPLNVMVANAGIAQLKPILSLTEDDVRRMFEVNVFGLFNCYQAAANSMISHPSTTSPTKKIIGACSIVGFKPFALASHYSASKFAVRGFTQAMAMEVADKGITVNAYAPGIVGTQMWDLIDEGLGRERGRGKGESFEKYTRELVAMGRPSTVEDVSKVVSFLAGGDSDYMTGQTVVVDGGIVMN